MQIKKFIGDNTAQIMSQIRQEFGDDAMILQTNTVKIGGFLGLFKKEQIEILAALDDETSKKYTPIKKPRKKETDNTLGIPVKSGRKKYEENFEQKYEKNNHAESDFKNRKSDSFSYAINSYAQDFSEDKEKIAMKNDLDEIKNTVYNLSKKINETFKTPEEEEEYQIILNNVNKLIKLGITEDMSNEIVNTALKYGNNFSKESIYKAINDVFSDYENEIPSNNKYKIFIGSTGVGKTTTLAKIASETAMNTKSKIGFMTLDTYRISAVEQLKTYAQILSCPIEVAYETKDIEASVQRLSNRDLVYIDTAGRSHNNKSQVLELKNILDMIDDKKIYLVLSANTNIDDICDIIKVYEFIENYSIIVTKLDETSKLGKIYDLISYAKKPIAYTTHGQNVPDDIENFDFQRFTGEFLKEF